MYGEEVVGLHSQIAWKVLIQTVLNWLKSGTH
jgi:hypothetical protein